jgi:hypothetical protein
MAVTRQVRLPPYRTRLTGRLIGGLGGKTRRALAILGGHECRGRLFAGIGLSISFRVEDQRRSEIR